MMLQFFSFPRQSHQDIRHETLIVCVIVLQHLSEFLSRIQILYEPDYEFEDSGFSPRLVRTIRARETWKC